MKTKLFLLCAFALIALVACAAPAPTATPVPPTTVPMPTVVPSPDLASVIKSQVDALNAGNVDAVMAFFADAATQTMQPPPAGQSGVWTGKEQIRGFFSGLIADHFSVELSNVKMAGDKITYTCTFSTDSYKKLGVAPIVAVEDTVFEGGKIKSKTITLTPESLAKIQAAMAAAQAKAAPTPTTAPPTSAPAMATPTPRAVSQATIRVGDLDRTYLYYVPANLPRNTPLLFALHAYRGVDAERMRAVTVYEFESLADQYGFVVVYPQGYQISWNACTKAETIPAIKQNIDDTGFIRALIAKFRADYGINTSRVFAMGFSQGGDMSYRLALEIPDEITAIATIGANLPTDDNNQCRASGKPIPVLIMSGTNDSLMPYNGGYAIQGDVRSVQATAEYFAKLNGQTSPPKTTRLPHQDPSDPTSVDRIVWSDAGKPEVILVRINEGGHTVPQPKIVFPSNTGRTNKDLNGLMEIWEFFARQRPLR
ncbi:MAG: nuclear transport factor 2 family protein [Chloroflexi bacterium]|nr:nuclear transport factor 2 family protein [Chloroflexota bacterium]